jgi:outer membrane protein assembly factor BamB
MSFARVELKKAVVTIEDDGGLLFVNKQGEEEGTLRLASVDPPDTWRLAKLTWTQLVLAMGEWLVWVDGDSRKVIRRVRARGKVADVVVEGAKLVARLEDGLTQAFDATTGEAKVAAPVTAICARGDLVISGDKAGRVRIQKNETDLATLSAGESVLGVHLTKKELAVAATARVLMRAAKPWSAPRPVALKAPSSSFAADDAYAFAGTMAGAVDVYDLENGKAVTSYDLSSDDRITALARLPGALLAVGTGALDGRVLLVDVAEAEIIHRIEPHQEAFGVTCLATDPRGRIVASGGDDGTVVLIDPAKGRILARLRMPETPASLAFEQSGRKLVCAFADDTAAIISLGAKGASVDEVDVHNVAKVAWSTSGPVYGLGDGNVTHSKPTQRAASSTV